MFNRLTSLLLLLTSGLAAAAPAPWYWWAGQRDDTRVCSQTSPGKGWTRVSFAYRDARCSIPDERRR